MAPRKDKLSPRVDNDGEDLVCLELENGVEIVSTFSGHTLSFVKDEINELRSLDVSSKGSQFRSRDIFPEAAAKVMENGQSLGLTFAEGIFQVSEGELVFAPGSSGGKDPFMEVVMKGRSAAARLGNPDPGDRIEFT